MRERSYPAVRDHPEADEIQQGTVERVEDEDGGRDGEHPPRRAARGFEHEHDHRGAEQHVAPGRVRRAVDEVVEVDERPRERHDGDGDQAQSSIDTRVRPRSLDVSG